MRGRRDEDALDESGGEDPSRLRHGFAGSWARLRPRFDDPMSWSMPVARIAGISVRVHLFFLLFIAIELLRAAFPASDLGPMRLGLALAAIAMGTLFLVVLLHEFGHCVACRRWGGVADEVLLWPLGGLASCDPPRDWRAHLWTALGGPLVNVAILACTIPALGLSTGRWWGVAIPSPLSLAQLAVVSDHWALSALFLLNWIAFVLLLFNLLPLFPLDGGRILQAALWPRVGYPTAMRIACRAGFVGAIALGVLGLWQFNLFLIMVAIFGGLTCVQTLRQLEFTQAALGYEDAEGEAFLGDDARVRLQDEESERDARKEAQRERTRREEESARLAREEAEFDRILDKIRRDGIASLTAAERRVLERETERRRRSGG